MSLKVWTQLQVANQCRAQAGNRAGALQAHLVTDGVDAAPEASSRPVRHCAQTTNGLPIQGDHDARVATGARTVLRRFLRACFIPQVTSLCASLLLQQHLQQRHRRCSIGWPRQCKYLSRPLFGSCFFSSLSKRLTITPEDLLAVLTRYRISFAFAFAFACAGLSSCFNRFCPEARMRGPDHEIMQGMPLLRKHIRKALVGSAGASTSCSSLSWTSCRRLSKDTPLLQALAEILDEVRLCSESHGVYRIRGVRPLTNLTQAQECRCACNELLRQACCNQAALSSVTASTGILEPDAARRHVCSLPVDGLTRPAAALSSSSRICTTLPCSPRTTSRRSWLGPTACATLKTSSGSSACARLAVRALALQIQVKTRRQPPDLAILISGALHGLHEIKYLLVRDRPLRPIAVLLVVHALPPDLAKIPGRHADGQGLRSERRHRAPSECLGTTHC